MTDRSPHTPRIFASLAIAGSVLVLAVLFLIPLWLQAPAAAQTVAIPPAAIISASQSARLSGVAQAAATRVVVLKELTREFSTPTQLPETTVSVPGPTAEFTIQLSIEDWLDYRDEQAGVRFQYPSNWYLSTSPPEGHIVGTTIDVRNYDAADPTLDGKLKAGTALPNLTRFEVTAIWNLAATGQSFLEGESISEWAARHLAIGPELAGEIELVTQRETTVGGVPAFLQSSKTREGGLVTGIYIKHGGVLYIVSFPTELEGSLNRRIQESILATLRFRQRVRPTAQAFPTPTRAPLSFWAKDEQEDQDAVPMRRLTPTLESSCYRACPTAQFTTMLPLEQWHVFEAKRAGFRIRYPPDWYLTAPPSDLRGAGFTTLFSSYDGRDPNVVLKGQPVPPNFAKLEIGVDSLAAMGKSYLPGETLSEWVRRTYPRDMDEYRILAEAETTLGGVPAFRQLVSSHGVNFASYFIHRHNDLVLVSYKIPPAGSYAEQVFARMLASFQVLQ